MKKEKIEIPKKHSVLRRIGKFLLILIILLVLFVGGFVGYSAYKNGWGWKGLIKTAIGTNQTAEELGEFQVLILGISQDISAELTDTIMIASYNPQTQKAVLLSIPRDTFVGNSKLSADSYDKINAIYQQKGAEGTLAKVNELTGLNVQNYIVINNNALVELVDEIGGVEFDVPVNMNYDSSKQDLHIHLEKGLQILNGEQAEGLVRYRKNNSGGSAYTAEYGNDDFGRMRTQREFIMAVAKQTIQAKNITKIGNLIDIVKKNVITNIKDWDSIKGYISYAVDFDTDNIETASIPGDSARIPAGTGLWFFLADEIETKKLVTELFTKQNSTDVETSVDENTTNSSTISSNTSSSINTTLSNATSSNTSSSTSTNSNLSSNTSTQYTNNSNIKIELLNGSGDIKLLTKATNALKDAGYNVYKTGTTSNTAVTTIINKSNLEESKISSLQSLLGVGVISSSSLNNSTVDVTIILGKDYE